MSSNQLLDITVNSTIVEATIGRKALLSFLTTSDHWPINEVTGKPMKIVDKELFFEELVAHLLEEDDQGSTLLHRAFEQAAINVVESGTEALEQEDPYADADDVDAEDAKEWHGEY